MAKFRKKPVVIEAWQWLFSEEQEIEPIWIIDAITGHSLRDVRLDIQGDSPRIIISTLEGDMAAYPGDWIIRGVKGELYPCKSDIFEATYEPVEET